LTKGWKSESVRHSLARKGIKTGKKKKTTYYSVWDNQTGNYLYSGRNSKSKKQALDSAFEFWASGTTELSDKEIRELEKDKENWLLTVGLIIHDHDEKMEDTWY